MWVRLGAGEISDVPFPRHVIRSDLGMTLAKKEKSDDENRNVSS